MLIATTESVSLAERMKIDGVLELEAAAQRAVENSVIWVAHNSCRPDVVGSQCSHRCQPVLIASVSLKWTRRRDLGPTAAIEMHRVGVVALAIVGELSHCPYVALVNCSNRTEKYRILQKGLRPRCAVPVLDQSLTYIVRGPDGPNIVRRDGSDTG